jgi:hypothetical protein
VVFSSDPEYHHWLKLDSLQAWSLYAEAGSSGYAGGLQWILPGCTSQWRNFSEGFTMKGVWSNDKSENLTYRVALDALSAVPEGLLASALLAVVENGCALMVSATRDKGALCLTLMDGDKRNRVYPASAAELVAALTDLRDSLSESTPKANRSTRSEKR